MSQSVRHLRRVHSVAELAESDRCACCGAPAVTEMSPLMAEGASTLDMTAPLPPVRACRDCAAAQERASREGRKLIAGALAIPAVLVALVTVLAPFGSPTVVPAAAVAGLVAARIALGRVRRIRGAAAKLVFLDGVEDEVLLQHRVEGERPAYGAYRDALRDVHEGGVADRPPLVRVRATLAFAGATLATGFLTLVGFFGAFPLLFLDNPSTEEIEVEIDGERSQLAAGGKLVVRVAYGEHRVAFAGQEPQTVRVGWGQNVLVSSRESQCYEVRSLARARSGAPGFEVSRAARGRVFGFDDVADITRADCRGLFPLFGD